MTIKYYEPERMKAKLLLMDAVHMMEFVMHQKALTDEDRREVYSCLRDIACEGCGALDCSGVCMNDE